MQRTPEPAKVTAMARMNAEFFEKPRRQEYCEQGSKTSNPHGPVAGSIVTLSRSAARRFAGSDSVFGARLRRSTLILPVSQTLPARCDLNVGIPDRIPVRAALRARA